MNFRPRIFAVAILTLAFSSFLMASPILAHQPQVSNIKGDNEIQKILDPTFASVAVYGSLSRPAKIDHYEFTASQNEQIPISLLVPKRPTLADFRPMAIILRAEDAPKSIDWNSLPPSAVVVSMGESKNAVFFEPFSQETYWEGEKQTIELVAEQRYVIFIRDSRNQTGDYVLGLGTKEDFSATNFGGLIKDLFRIKFGLVDGRTVPWLDMMGLFLLLLGVALGIGSAASFAVRAYRQEVSSTVQMSLPWIGLALTLIGTPLAYWSTGFSGMASLQLFIALGILITQILMTFKVHNQPGDFKSIGHTAAVVAHAWAIFLFLSVWQQMMLR